MLIRKNTLVKVDNFSCEMLYALGVATEIYADYGHDCVVTAGQDGKHNPGSLHPAGKAVDIRTSNLLPEELALVMTRLKKRLESMGFDVILEGDNATAATTAPHIHIEYDPKPGDQFWRV